MPNSTFISRKSTNVHVIGMLSFNLSSTSRNHNKQTNKQKFPSEKLGKLNIIYPVEISCNYIASVLL